MPHSANGLFYLSSAYQGTRHIYELNMYLVGVVIGINLLYWGIQTVKPPFSKRKRFIHFICFLIWGNQTFHIIGMLLIDFRVPGPIVLICCSLLILISMFYYCSGFWSAMLRYFLTLSFCYLFLYVLVLLLLYGLVII